MDEMSECISHGYCTLQSDCKNFRLCGCGSEDAHCMYCLLPPVPVPKYGSADVCPECKQSLEGAPVVKV